MEMIDGMIDLHSHILPGLDDGPRTMEESLQMCAAYYRDGVRTVVATPHTLNDVYLNDRSVILSKVRELNKALLQSEICSLQSAFEVLPGADVHFCEDILQHLGQGRLTTLGGGTRFLMIEFPVSGIPYRAEEILFQMISKEMIPIISHPERNLEVTQRPHRYYDIIRMGCLGQVTAMSLTGGFGSGIKKTAEKLTKSHLVHFIATDAHSTNGRPPILSQAVRAAERIVGKDEARRMVTQYPQAILQGKRPDVPEPRSL